MNVVNPSQTRLLLRYSVCQRIDAVGLPAAGQQLSFHEVVIVDNGICFDQSDVDRVFRMFQRLHSRSSYSGTGMGVAICKKIVENHQGYITAQSQPGQGARFAVFLPIN
ncbi:sensor histidine kinase [Spirosoma fluminis]